MSSTVDGCHGNKFLSTREEIERLQCDLFSVQWHIKLISFLPGDYL